jgi:hypothetical protein
MSAYGTPEAEVRKPSSQESPNQANSASHDAVDDASSMRDQAWIANHLNPRLVLVLTVLGFVLPVVGYLTFLRHYQVNALWQDQWDDVPVIRESFRHFPDWSSLWLQHVDNRILFPNLVVVALAHTVHYNILVEEFVGALMLFVATGLLIWSHRRRSPATPLLYYCPVAFLTLTLSQWQNTLWGFQMAWYLVVLALAVTIVLLDLEQFAMVAFVAAIAAAVVGSYSSLQGLLIWPVGLLLLYQRRRPLWAGTIWIAAAAATTILYFHNFAGSNAFDPNKTVLKVPFYSVKFFVFALGDVVGVQQHSVHQPANKWVMAFGAAILVLAVLVLARWGFRRDERSPIPIGVALIVYGLLFDAFITQGRVFLGYFAASASRYTTNDVLVLVGIYLTVLASPTRSSVRRNSSEDHSPEGSRVASLKDRSVRWVDGVPFKPVIAVLIIIEIVASLSLAFSGARNLHQIEVGAQSVTQHIEREPAEKVVANLYFVRSKSWLTEQTEFLRAHHLGQFG